jgi:hypothetical protein
MEREGVGGRRRGIEWKWIRGREGRGSEGVGGGGGGRIKKVGVGRVEGSWGRKGGEGVRGGRE